MTKHKAKSPAGKKSKGFVKTPEYWKLVTDIKKIVGDAAAQWVDISKRSDTLTCKACGCYENVLFSGQWVICDASKKIVSNKEFIIIDRKERPCRRGKTTTYKITFDFICSQCGCRQKEIIRETFED